MNKNSWLVVLIVVLGLSLIVIKKFNFSLTDFVAQRVIEKLNADYSPYGPQVPMVQAPPMQMQQPMMQPQSFPPQR